jgi:hypothetical protein
MMCPQAATGDGGLQIRMIAMNILIKQSRTADRGWTCSLSMRHGTSKFLSGEERHVSGKLLWTR